MSVITIVIKTLTALGDGEVIVISASSPYIKKIGSSFTSSDSFAVNTFHFFVVVLVRHSCCFLVFRFFMPDKYRDVSELAKFSKNLLGLGLGGES